MAIACQDDDHWRRWPRSSAAPTWPPRHRRAAARRGELDGLVAAWTRQRRTPTSVQDRLQAAGVAAHDVQNSRRVRRRPPAGAPAATSACPPPHHGETFVEGPNRAYLGTAPTPRGPARPSASTPRRCCGSSATTTTGSPSWSSPAPSSSPERTSCRSNRCSTIVGRDQRGGAVPLAGASGRARRPAVRDEPVVERQSGRGRVPRAWSSSTSGPPHHQQRARRAHRLPLHDQRVPGLQPRLHLLLRPAHPPPTSTSTSATTSTARSSSRSTPRRGCGPSSSPGAGRASPSPWAPTPTPTSAARASTA